MKFKIRYADQIVGMFSIISIVGLIVLVFAIGARHNIFIKKNFYYTELSSGSGIKAGMDINYKGFSIGKIKNVELKNDRVTVSWFILEDYFDYVKENSLLELSASPIGLGSSFIFHPGNGTELVPSGTEIFELSSEMGKKIVAEKKCPVEKGADAVSQLLSQIPDLLNSVQTLLNDITLAVEGKGDNTLTVLLKNISGITGNLDVVTKSMAQKEGLLPSVIGVDTGSEVNKILQQVNALVGTVDSLGGSADNILSSNTKTINALLSEIGTLLLELEDTLEGVQNNPLLRKGVPDRTKTDSSLVNVRGDLE